MMILKAKLVIMNLMAVMVMTTLRMEDDGQLWRSYGGDGDGENDGLMTMMMMMMMLMNDDDHNDDDDGAENDKNDDVTM